MNLHSNSPSALTRAWGRISALPTCRVAAIYNNTNRPFISAVTAPVREPWRMPRATTFERPRRRGRAAASTTWSTLPAWLPATGLCPPTYCLLLAGSVYIHHTWMALEIVPFPRHATNIGPATSHVTLARGTDPYLDQTFQLRLVPSSQLCRAFQGAPECQRAARPAPRTKTLLDPGALEQEPTLSIPTAWGTYEASLHRPYGGTVHGLCRFASPGWHGSVLALAGTIVYTTEL